MGVFLALSVATSNLEKDPQKNVNIIEMGQEWRNRLPEAP